MKIFESKKTKIENRFLIRPKHLGRRPNNEKPLRTRFYPVFSLVFLYSVLSVLMNINKLIYKDVVVLCRDASRLSCSCIPKLFWRFAPDVRTECVFLNVFIGKVTSQALRTSPDGSGRMPKWE
jgi:hypothetical protein